MLFFSLFRPFEITWAIFGKKKKKKKEMSLHLNIPILNFDYRAHRAWLSEEKRKILHRFHILLTFYFYSLLQRHFMTWESSSRYLGECFFDYVGNGAEWAYNVKLYSTRIAYLLLLCMCIYEQSSLSYQMREEEHGTTTKNMMIKLK